VNARPLKVGIGLPDAERQMAGGTARWADLLAMAQRAEAVGFDSVWVEDHLLFRLGDTPTEGPWECWTLLSALAASTSRVEIGPLVACTSFRNPALLAKMADTVDEISGGRLILGLGAGWHEPEYQAFGFPFDHRVSRFGEALKIIHGLLHDGQIDFEGKYYQARECELRPRGPRPNGPPILLGTTSPRMLRLTAQYADIWNTYFTRHENRPEGVAPLRGLVDAACVEVGRDPATLGRTCAVLVGFDDRFSGPSSANPSGTPPLTGSPAEIAATLRGFATEGISHVQVWLEPNDLSGIESFAPVLELLDQ
jgi:alkanesulfonate monooxygenase SsuD/methylene tetrahydromethanopterin reductase-like flavin-dependent oxidoreductase (luciferase family)